MLARDPVAARLSAMMILAAAERIARQREACSINTPLLSSTINVAVCKKEPFPAKGQTLINVKMSLIVLVFKTNICMRQCIN